MNGVSESEMSGWLAFDGEIIRSVWALGEIDAISTLADVYGEARSFFSLYAETLASMGHPPSKENVFLCLTKTELVWLSEKEWKAGKFDLVMEKEEGVFFIREALSKMSPRQGAIYSQALLRKIKETV